MDECPDLETIAEYLDGRLNERERQHMAEHLAACETCYFVFTEAAQMRRTETIPEHGESARVRPFFVRWRVTRVAWSAAAAGLATAAALLLAVSSGWLPLPRSSESPELVALVAAVGTDRTVEPRLTGGFAHGPMRVVRGTEPSTVSPDVRIAAAEVEKVSASQSLEALRARGIASLVIGDTERAVATLEEAAQKRPGDARIHSDLAAAYLVRASQNMHADDNGKALASANRALNIDRKLAEAWFNRAFALERLSMTQEARDAWKGYLALDDRSGWADEARVHLRTLNGER